MRETRSGSHLRVDPVACQAHGVCVEALPEMIERDPWGYPLLAQQVVPERLLAHARRAVDLCPTLALKLVPAEQATRR
ncbi:MAG TPA: ferredoxin [Actinocrinis sp.]|jgi:ferredoxin